MNPIAGIYTTTVGKKILMAVTGIILVLYVLAHMMGNLQIYIGAKQIDAYARLLHSTPPLLWGARAVLIFCVLVHIVAAVQLWLRNRASRPVKYRVFRPPEVDIAARTMVWSGPILLAFIIYHILHLTTGDAHPQYEELAPFHNVVTGFAVWWAAGIYIVANLLLAFHLYHGVWSLFQTLGWDHPRWGYLRRILAAVVAVVVGAANISIPLAVLAGVLHQ
ncbi:MAG TPA: succinate dehydrogenase cytochrome b subunit [Thermoanaerobaculales bacterium]|nr:succinate dehydrogenase cytochrome b subunit [Thermoanaerobaculales bacterium]